MEVSSLTRVTPISTWSSKQTHGLRRGTEEMEVTDTVMDDPAYPTALKAIFTRWFASSVRRYTPPTSRSGCTLPFPSSR